MALQRKDLTVVSSVIDAMYSFGTRYGDFKPRPFSPWYRIQDWIRQSPDFVNLSFSQIAVQARARTWVEYKILRQYQRFFADSLTRHYDISLLVAINTRKLAEGAVCRNDIDVLDVCIKFFNTVRARVCLCVCVCVCV